MKDYVPNNMLTNPFNAPLKSGNYIPKDFTDIRGVPGIPVNVKTQGPDLEYKQVGILTRITGPETILALMGSIIYGGYTCMSSLKTGFNTIICGKFFCASCLYSLPSWYYWS